VTKKKLISYLRWAGYAKQDLMTGSGNPVEEYTKGDSVIVLESSKPREAYINGTWYQLQYITLEGNVGVDTVYRLVFKKDLAKIEASGDVFF
jgi:hypothetical protein